MTDDRKVQLGKIGKGALIAAAGALLTYLLEAVPGMDLGDYTPIVTALLAVAVNIVRKLPL